MFYGRNESGKEFDLVDDDDEVFASSDSLDDIRATERTTPAICGVLRLRRDRANAPKGAFVRVCIPREWD